MAGVVANLDSYINSAARWSSPTCTSRWCRGGPIPTICAWGKRWSWSFWRWALRSPMIQPVFGSVFEAFQTFMTFFQGPLLALLLLAC